MLAKMIDQARQRRSAKTVNPETDWWTSPVKPSARLMPGYVRENRATAAVARKVLIGFAGCAVVTAVAFAAAFAVNQSAERELAAAEATRATVNTEIAELAGVETFYTGLEARRGAVSDAVAGQVHYARVLEAVLAARPNKVTIVTLSTTRGETCSGPTPFEKVETLGCLNITGVAPSAEDVSGFVAALNASPSGLLAQAFAPRTDGERTAGFTVTVNFTPAAMTAADELEEPTE